MNEVKRVNKWVARLPTCFFYIIIFMIKQYLIYCYETKSKNVKIVYMQLQRIQMLHYVLYTNEIMNEVKRGNI